MSPTSRETPDPAPPADPFPWHPPAWTLDEVLALPEDNGQRVELVDGALVLSPSPDIGHQRVLQRVQVALCRAAPDGYEVMPGINVVLDPRRLPIPDVAVTSVPGLDARYRGGADIVLAVEVVSPWSRAYDSVLKRQLYAEAGVPFFLLVDSTVEPASASCHELVGGTYREISHAENGTLVLSRPFDVTVRLG